MIIIPIGVQCTAGIFKNEINKTHTLPFDVMLSHPKFVFEMLALLLEKNMNVVELVTNHFFNCDKRVKFKAVEHFNTCDNGGMLYNKTCNVIFPHDNNSIETINKYVRRFERLKDIILNQSEDLLFTYISQSSLKSGNFTIDDNIIIKDVYVYLSQIYKLIGNFRNNYKVLLFDAIQEEQIELLDENIILCKLNKCNSWSELLPEIRTYKHLFT